MPAIVDDPLGIEQQSDPLGIEAKDDPLQLEPKDDPLAVEPQSLGSNISASDKLGVFQPSQFSSGVQYQDPTLNPDYDFTRATGGGLSGLVAKGVNAGMDLAGKAAVGIANLPTTVANKVRGAKEGDPNYTEPLQADQPTIHLPELTDDDLKTLNLPPAVKGVHDALRETLEGLTEPQMALTLPALGLESIAKPITTAFATQLAANLPSDVQRITTAQGQEEAAKAWADTAIHAMMLKGASEHSMTSESTPETPPTPNAAGQPTPEPAAPSVSRFPLPVEAQSALDSVKTAPEPETSPAATPKPPVESLVQGQDFLNIKQPHKVGIEAGLNLTPDDVPDVKFLQEQSNSEMKEAVASGDSEAFKAAFGKSTFLGGVIEGAEKKGPNYDLYQQQLASSAKENVPAPNESINPIMGNTQSAAGDEINKGSITTPALSPEPPLSEASSKTEPLPNSEPVKEEVAPSQNKEQPQFVGMGGAIPDEFKNDPQTPTGIRNAMVDSERAKRGLPESMQVAAKGFGTVWDEAMTKIDKDPESQDALIDELRNKPRALTDVEDAMLLHRQIDLQNEYGKATRDLAQAYDDGRTGAVDEGKVRVANLSDKLLDIYNIGKKSGTESGRGLNARKLMATEDFSLAEMEIQKRAANQGKPLTEQQRQEINDLHKKIQSAQQAHDDYVKATTDRIAKSETARIEAERKAQGVPRFDKRILDHAERIVSKMEGAAKDASTRLKERLSRLSAGVDPTIVSDAAIVASAKIARLGLDLARLTDAMVEEYGEKIRSLMPEIWKAANKLVNDNTKDAPDEVKRAVRKGATSTEEQRLQTWKTRTANRIKELQDKIAAKDYSKKPRQAVPMDEQALRLKANLERLKQQFKEGLQRDQMKQRTFVEKSGDFIARLRRAFILSNPLVLGKLFAAAVARLGVTPVEEMVGAGIGKAIPDVANIAPREGGINLKAEVHSVAQAFTKGMADAWNILKTGKSNLDVAYGEMEPQPRHWIDFVGSIHGALKAPVKRAEFSRSFEKRAQFYANKGVDITNPLVQAKIGLEAYKDANKSIFMQDNFMASRINRLFSSEKDKTGHETLAGKAWSTTGNVLLPIRKIPTNIVAEGIRYMTGTATGSVRLAAAFKNGIENLKPEQADLIMGDLKKGTLGAAALLYGYFNYNNVGGYYDGKKRKTGDVKFGDIVIGGTEIDHTYLHNPFLENIQIGANMRRVMEDKLSKGDNKPSAISEAAGASALGLIYEAPFVREMTEVSKAFNPNERGAFFGELGKSLLVPQFVSWTAEHMDKNAQGETNKRAPKSVVQHIETGIPKLRENVPLSKK